MLASQNLEQVNLRVKEAFVAGGRGYISRYQDVFIIEKPERYNERFTIVKTDSGVEEVADAASYPLQGVNEIGANTITVRIYKSAIAISDLMSLFNNYGTVAKIAKTRGYHFKAKTDALCADFLNNGTSTTSPYGFNVSGTTYAAFSTTQPIGDSGSTQSNRVTGDLDKTTLNAGTVRLTKMKDHDGMIAHYQARRLVVPQEEMLNAWQLTASPNEPESANRNLNYLNELNIQPIPWPLLTSTTACFLLGAKDDFGAKGLRMEVAEMPTVRMIVNQQTGNVNYQMRMVLFPGVIDYQGMVSIGL